MVLVVPPGGDTDAAIEQVLARMTAPDAHLMIWVPVARSLSSIAAVVEGHLAWCAGVGMADDTVSEIVKHIPIEPSVVTAPVPSTALRAELCSDRCELVVLVGGGRRLRRRVQALAAATCTTLELAGDGWVED
jgi:hypothetical protein